LKIGDKVPDFRLVDDEGNPFSLYEELQKGPLVLYFYPRDFTSGCTAEACSFRDSYNVFINKGYRIVGISSDSPERHRKFRSSYSLPFTLLTDADRSVAVSLGIPRKFGIIPGRVTLVIDKDATLQYIFNSLTDISGHVDGALKAIGGAP
jgi:peroxiredoxin Q/BCP